MTECTGQLHLEGTDVPDERLRLSEATCWRGLRGVAECRAILAEKSLDSD